MSQGQRRVFVSHCSADREAASRLAEALDRQGVATWVAPRDVAPARDYSEQLDEAIRDAAAVVVLASAAYADSIAAKGEADQAASLGKAVYPVRVDGEGSPPALPGAAFWTDAFGPNADRNVARLAEELRAAAPVATPATAAPEPQAAEAVAPEPEPMAAAVTPSAPPAAPAEPAPQVAVAEPAPQVAAAEPAPVAAPAGQSSGRKLIFIGLGVVMIIVGLVRMSDGLRQIFGSGGATRSSSASSTLSPASGPGTAAMPSSGAEAPPQSLGPLPSWAQGFAGDWSDDNCRTALRLVADGTFTARQAGGGVSSGYGYWTMAAQGGGDFTLSLAGSGGRFQTYRITNVGPSSFTMTAAGGGRSSLASRC